MVLTETHCHTKEISLCASVPANEIPALYHSAGYGAIIVTDHYNLWTLDELEGDRVTRIDRWLEGYRTVKAESDKLGLRVFLGMELALIGSPEDYLIYGVEESFLFRYPDLVEYALPQVFDIVSREGLLIYQAHPFRDYLNRAPLRFLHGVEVYNGNPRHNSHNDQAAAYAQKHSLMKIAGSDFHELEDLGRAGIYLPDGIDDIKKLIAFLRQNEVALYVSPMIP